MRALDWSVSGSETYATKPALDRSASHSRLWHYASCRAPECGPPEALFSRLLRKIKGFQTRMHGLFLGREEPQTRNVVHT